MYSCTCNVTRSHLQLCSCVECVSGLCIFFFFTWVTLRMAHLRRFWSSLYEKHINIEVYWTWFFTLCTLYSVFYKTQWETGNLFMFFFQSRALNVVCHRIHIHIFYVFHVEASSLSLSMHHSWKDLRPSKSQNWFFETTHIKSQTTSVSHWMKVWVDKF